MKAKKSIICILTATVFLAGAAQALDYDELSVSPSRILALRDKIRSIE